jgi:diacylglycerol kinase
MDKRESPPSGEQQRLKPYGSGFRAGFRYARDGILYVVRTQRNMRFHVVAGAAVVVLGAVLHLSAVEWALLLLCITSLLVAEMGNTLIELLVDLVSPGYHPLAKRVKDVSAGAVLVMAIGSAAVGLAILGPHVWQAVRH